MITITQTKTFFQKPPRISQEEYQGLRYKLLKEPSFKIDASAETFSQHFSKELRFLGWAIGYSVFYGIIYPVIKSNDLESSPIFYVLAMAAVIAGLGIFFVLVFILMMDGPSYATYIKDRKSYFDRMELLIKSTNSYSEFVKAFYS